MTPEELLAAYKAGDHSQLNATWEAWLPARRRAVANLGKDGIYADHGDIEQWSYEGLLDAIRRFDPTLGKRFYDYSFVRIRGFVKDRLRQQRSRSTKAQYQRTIRPGTHYAGPAPEMDLNGFTIDDAIERNHAMTELARAVSQIPGEDQEAILQWLADGAPKSREALLALRDQLLTDRCKP